MLKHKDNRTQQTQRLLRWIQTYPAWWYLICTPGAKEMTRDMMCNLIKRLADKGFYEIIFVLIMVHRNASFMKLLPEYMLLDSLVDQWQRDKDKLIDNVIYHLT